MNLYELMQAARDDLAEIEDFIGRRMNNERGAKIVEDYLFEAFEKIGRDPAHCGGRRKPHITARPGKFLTVKKYVVYYDDTVRPVAILRIFGARRDIARLLQNEK